MRRLVTPPRCAAARPDPVKKVSQQRTSLRIGDAVDATGPEAALEGSDDVGRREADGGRVAEALESRLYVALEGALEPLGARARPQPDAGVGQRRPGKAQAGIDLALGGDVGMAHDVARHDGGMAPDYAVAKLDQRRYLRLWIVMAIAVQVDDLHAGRGGVQGLAAAPVRAAGVPGNAILGHEPMDPAVFRQHVVRADAMLARAIAQD